MRRCARQDRSARRGDSAAIARRFRYDVEPDFIHPDGTARNVVGVHVVRRADEIQHGCGTDFVTPVAEQTAPHVLIVRAGSGGGSRVNLCRSEFERVVTGLTKARPAIRIAIPAHMSLFITNTLCRVRALRRCVLTHRPQMTPRCYVTVNNCRDRFVACSTRSSNCFTVFDSPRYWSQV